MDRCFFASLNCLSLNFRNKDTTTKMQPVHPKFTSERKRFDSFSDWPVALKQSPTELAESGYFYTNYSDWVVCFYCGNGVTYWEENDKPHEQHALHSPNCRYLRVLKGEGFIREVSKNIKPSKVIPYTYNKRTDVKECVLCCDNERNVVFLECGHIITCISCGLMSSECAICRTKISSLKRAYLS